MFSAVRMYNYDFQSTGKSTYWPIDPLKKPDLMDFFITQKGCKNYIKSEENLEIDTDLTYKL